ncbi:DNA replication/repair protein RecF [Sneathiella sp. P13V-1]|uniref:DNA replication/repair protein RecF n=1 Tax=Sneathiella sp. P13V-1 TaxID=2697366 RepID=UPI00187B4CC0|nr:DNA replication/repair protein RecF [Sneathiella sp. P13V-1]MBE7636037.1 DNA replication/repair protein RecF [Sneathiella sp. P13V-1]
MPPLALTRLVLNDFRNYTYLKLDTDTRPVVLTGPNGSGKTNLLEAISFLSPGRGLRRARLHDPARQDGDGQWVISANIINQGFEHKVGSGLLRPAGGGPGSEKRTVRIDGVDGKRTSDLGEIFQVSWLTPQMDRLFTDTAGGRRRFLDRLTYGFDPEHAKRTASFEKIMRQRNRLLKEGRMDPHWLNSLEHQMAELAISIIAARGQTIDRLNQAMEEGKNGDKNIVIAFPKALLQLTGALEERIKDMPALMAEDSYKQALENNRKIDAAAGSTTHGPHRSDLGVFHREKDQAAALCSTGEQKALLISIILSNARLQAGLHGKAPVLLLDEITAHLDRFRRCALFDEISRLNMQAWMTGTDEALFAEFADRAQFFTVENGTLTRV